MATVAGAAQVGEQALFVRKATGLAVLARTVRARITDAGAPREQRTFADPLAKVAEALDAVATVEHGSTIPQ